MHTWTFFYFVAAEFLNTYLWLTKLSHLIGSTNLLIKTYRGNKII